MEPSSRDILRARLPETHFNHANVTHCRPPTYFHGRRSQIGYSCHSRWVSGSHTEMNKSEAWTQIRSVCPSSVYWWSRRRIKDFSERQWIWADCIIIIGSFENATFAGVQGRDPVINHPVRAQKSDPILGWPWNPPTINLNLVSICLDEFSSV